MADDVQLLAPDTPNYKPKVLSLLSLHPRGTCHFQQLRLASWLANIREQARLFLQSLDPRASASQSALVSMASSDNLRQWPTISPSSSGILGTVIGYAALLEPTCTLQPVACI